MATREQLFKRLNRVVGTEVVTRGARPPRLVRANSAFSKRKLSGGVVVEIDGGRETLGSGLSLTVG